MRSIAGLPRLAVLAVVVGALLLRLVVPAGWMAVGDAHGLRFTLCTGMGAMPMPQAEGMAMSARMHASSAHGTPAHDHGASGDHAPDRADHACPFAAAALPLGTPVAPPLLPPLAAALVFAPAAAWIVAIGRGLAAPPPPATGPPASI